MPVRKNLRLKDFDYSRPGAYFITVCTKGRKLLLGSVVGGDAHIAPYTKLSATGNVVQKYLSSIPGIGAYVIMPNHVHMIIHISTNDPLQGPMWASPPTGVTVANLVKSWKTLVSKELGYSVWQRSYYDHIVRDEQEYIRLVQYIEENPAKWCEDTYYC